MAIKNFNFTIDTITQNNKVVANVKQLDNAIFNITVTENNQLKDLTNQTIKLFVKKPNDDILIQTDDINIIDSTNGKLKINVKNSIFENDGLVVGELDIKGADGEISTATFIINVYEKIRNSTAITAKVDIDLFAQITSLMNTATKEIEQYKAYYDSFSAAGVSLEGLDNIKSYIDNNLANLKNTNNNAATAKTDLDNAIKTAATSKNDLESTIKNSSTAKEDLQETINNSATTKTDIQTVVTTAKNDIETAVTNAKNDIQAAAANATNKAAGNYITADDVDTKISTAKTDIENNIDTKISTVKSDIENDVDSKILTVKTDIKSSIDTTKSDLESNINTTKNNLENEIANIQEQVKQNSSSSITNIKIDNNASTLEVNNLGELKIDDTANTNTSALVFCNANGDSGGKGWIGKYANRTHFTVKSNTGDLILANDYNSNISVGEDGYLYPTADAQWALGKRGYRWSNIYTQNVTNSSDKRLKENIKYINKSPKDSTDTNITNDDLYNFVKDNLKLATYNYTTYNKEEENSNKGKLGFIAQDLLNDAVGKSILNSSNTNEILTYDLNNYINTLAGALQKTIAKIEKLETAANLFTTTTIKIQLLGKQITNLKLQNLQLQQKINNLENNK